MLLDAELFERHMLFYTFEDFMKNRLHIKDTVSNYDYKQLVLYRLYIFSRPWIKDYFRGVIWDYLNDDIEDAELEFEYEKYLAKYGGNHA